MEKITLNPGIGFKKYYAENPKREFLCTSDEFAKKQCNSTYLYRKEKTHIVVLRDDITYINGVRIPL